MTHEACVKVTVDQAGEIGRLRAQNEKMRAAIQAECHRLEHDYNEADVTAARRNLLRSLSSAE